MLPAVAVSGVVCANAMDLVYTYSDFLSSTLQLRFVCAEKLPNRKKGAEALFYDIVYRLDFITIGSKSYFDNSDSTTSSNQDSA